MSTLKDFDPSCRAEAPLDTPEARRRRKAEHGISDNPDYTPPVIFRDTAPETVRVVASASPGGFVTINAADFDPARHTRFKPQNSGANK